MTVFLRILVVFIICVTIYACPSSNKTNVAADKCKYGTPTPVFSKDLEKVADHFFSSEGQKGMEKVKFENGLELELLQAGCNDLMQSYQFAMKGDLNGDDQFWVEQAVEQFRYLSTLSDNHISFSLWAGAIAKSAEFISLGESFEPEPNTFIKIDKIPSGEKTILVVTFEAKG